MLNAIYNAMGELARGGVKPEHVVIKLPELEYNLLRIELDKQFVRVGNSPVDGLTGYIAAIATPNGKVVIENTGRAMPNGQTR